MHLKKNNNIFDKLNNKLIDENIIIKIKKFIKSKFLVSLISYTNHTRVIFKDSNKIILIDPWKQKKDRYTKKLIKEIKQLEFIKRKPEQGYEGSCSFIALARALHLSHIGVSNFKETIPFDYIILASRMITKFRGNH